MSKYNKTVWQKNYFLPMSRSYLLWRWKKNNSSVSDKMTISSLWTWVVFCFLLEILDKCNFTRWMGHENERRSFKALSDVKKISFPCSQYLKWKSREKRIFDRWMYICVCIYWKDRVLLTYRVPRQLN